MQFLFLFKTSAASRYFCNTKERLPSLRLQEMPLVVSGSTNHKKDMFTNTNLIQIQIQNIHFLQQKEQLSSLRCDKMSIVVSGSPKYNVLHNTNPNRCKSLYWSQNSGNTQKSTRLKVVLQIQTCWVIFNAST